MKTYIDKSYGADADGNRGTTMVEFEVEESDRDEIEAQIQVILADYDADDYPEEVNVILYSDKLNEGVAIMVDVCDYI
jgi:hypothetical protein